ncbi:hypothetical protein UFOVP115_109 [uncultured Caudovirales phage]|uniref:Uncharacterized protein n=1 Tax=uncultured Caudovirales phage TaxID=2100421 RepID=A0A6J5L8V0_9CAUD|nr:hypothetical protein UFOVP115_109 [uncultured Caudovirales phage]
MKRYDSQKPGLPNHYDFGNGNSTTLSESDLEHMHSGKKGQEWHPGGVNPENGEKFLKHHSWISYMNGCRNCERMHEAGIHPNGNRENLR